MNVLNEWQKATQNLAENFVTTYYGKLEEQYTHWAGGEIGDIFFVNDDFYSVDKMRQALELKVSFELIQEFFDLEMEYMEKKEPVPTNFRNFVKYHKGFKK